MDRIELEAKSDRELLIMVADCTNDLCRDVTEVKDGLRAQNGRIRSLEDWRNWVTGGMALLTVLIMLFGAWLLGKV